MFDELNRQLIDLREKMNMNARLQKKLSGARASLIQLKSKRSHLGAILESETNDVRKLEGLSLTALFYAILGNKDQQLEKERQECLAAKLRYDECGQAISVIENELSEIQLRIRGLENPKSQYANLLAEKEKLIATTDNPSLKRLIDLSEHLADLQSNIKEINEAISTGKEVIGGLEHVIESLKSAENWGTWDMLGGGLLVTAMKHSRIDDARSGVSYLQGSLRRFQRELTDVNIGWGGISEIDIGSFATFSDYFFDGLISDWVVQGKIKDSLWNAEQMLERIRKIVRDLQAKLVDLQERAGAVMDDKRKLVELA